MENTDPTQPGYQYQAPKMRNTFLTVICILTFIGSGWGIVSAVRSYLQADEVATMAAESFSQAEEKMEDSPSFLKSFLSSAAAATDPNKLRTSSIISFLACLLTLGGAIMMWRLSKTGFYLYVAGIAVTVIAPIILFPGAVGAIAAGGAAFIGGIFIILYAVNLKQMS